MRDIEAVGQRRHALIARAEQHARRAKFKKVVGGTGLEPVTPAV
jgi:hypothetical protein